MINLFIPYFIDKNEERYKEVYECLQKNSLNPFIDRIILVAENPDIYRIMKRFDVIIVPERPTYNMMFEIINEITGPEDWNVLINSDIYLDETIKLIEKYDRNTFLALARWDIDKQGNAKLFNTWDSQDTWAFKGKAKAMKADFVQGRAGCLSGDTIVSYNRGKRSGTRPMTMKLLYECFSGKKKNFKAKNIPTFIQCFDKKNNKIILNEVLNVIESGVKDTIKITFDNGSELKLTGDHQIFMPNGECKEAASFHIGEDVLCKGTMLSIKRTLKRKTAKRAVVYLKYHPFAENKTIRGHKYKRVRRHRLVYEANMNGLDYETFLFYLKNDEEKSKQLKFLAPEMEVHHIDEDSMNDVIENLCVLTKSEHAKLHYSKDTFPVDYFQKRTIKSIENNGKVMTYDITMKSPHHNFCANGIVVHNCDNAIANRAEVAGYKVINPSKTIKTYHLHLTNIRNYNPNDRVEQPYKLINPHE